MTAPLPDPLPGTLPIRSRREYFDLWQRGAIGNHLRIWRALADIPPGIDRVMVREMNLHGGGGVVRVRKVRNLRRNPPRVPVSYNELAPDHLATCQAYVRKLDGRLYLLAKLSALEKLPMRPERMRQAIRRAKLYEGLRAAEIVRNRASVRDSEDILELMDVYPGHVLEFTTYAVTLGCVPGSNTIFWELRGY